MSLFFRSLLCGCSRLVHTVPGGNRLHSLSSGRICTALALCIVGLCPGTVRAQWTIDDPNGVGHTAFGGIDGSNIVGGYTDSMMRDHGFIYNGQTFTPLDDPDGVSTDPFAISGNNIVGSYTDSLGQVHGFLYDGTTFTTLDVPLSIETTVHGISGSNVVGEYVDSSFDQYLRQNLSRRKKRVIRPEFGLLADSHIISNQSY